MMGHRRSAVGAEGVFWKLHNFIPAFRMFGWVSPESEKIPRFIVAEKIASCKINIDLSNPAGNECDIMKKSKNFFLLE